jgi:DNA-binding beta-propeller fold protein YncE
MTALSLAMKLCGGLIVAFAMPIAAFARESPQQRDLSIETVAGTGVAENNGDAGAALATNISDPFGVEIGPDGALYITEVGHHRVRRLDLETGKLTTVAGCGRRGYAGDGGPAAEADLNEPYEVRFDRDGNMLFVEMQNHLVRRVDARTGVISTIAGTGSAGFGGDGGPATGAQFRQPHSIALDAKGAIYVADIGNHRIRRIDPATGLIDTIAGNGERTGPREGQRAFGNPILGPRALAIDGDTMWIALRKGHSVWRMNLGDGVLHHVAGAGTAAFSGDGGPAIDAHFNGPKGIALDADGNVLVVDTENHVIRRIDAATGTITTIAGSSSTTSDGEGDAALDRTAPATSVRLNRPHGICVGPDGSIYIGDTLNHVVRRVR